MNILVTGADGFIGQHLVMALVARRHRVRGAVRRPDHFAHLFPGLEGVPADFTQEQRPEDWLPRLVGIEAVVNAVGIFTEHGAQTFEAIHFKAPRALFMACAQAGVRRVIQISALGADPHAHSRFHLSKRAADDALAALDMEGVSVQPSLVFGPGGQSASLFIRLAAMPFLVVPGKGEQQVQPVHVDDLVEAIRVLLESETPRRGRLAVVGPKPVSLREFFVDLRGALGLPPTAVVPIPQALMALAVPLGEWLKLPLLSRDALEMLERGNTASPEAVERLLGRPPRLISEFIPPVWQSAARHAARFAWLRPLLRLALAFVWFIAGIVSLGIYPVEQSYALLAATGIAGVLAPLALYGASLLDLALGAATLVLRRARRLWQLQIGVILFYSAVITWHLPEFWAHPFGPLAKNIPILALLVVLLATEE